MFSGREISPFGRNDRSRSRFWFPLFSWVVNSNFPNTFFIAMFIKRGVINPLLFIPNDDAWETQAPELEIDDYATHSAVAVAKRMDRFEIKMEFGDLVGKVINVAGVKFPQNCLHHGYDPFRRRRNMGSHTNIFTRGAETPGSLIVD